MKDYIEKDDNGYRIAGTRVSLDSVVYAFREGQSPEGIVRSFPVLQLEQVYGAITFYLAHRSEIDAYLDQVRQDYEAARQAERAADPGFYERLARARRQQVASR